MSEEPIKRFNERINKLFSGWSPFGDDWDDLWKDINENFSFEMPKETEGKSYRMSYRYETGMDEPEIYVEGDASEDDVERFVNGIQSRFGKQLADVSDRKIKMLSEGDQKDKVFRRPVTKLEYGEDSVIATIQMPGIGKENISIATDGEYVTITGENGDLRYKKKLALKFNAGDVDIAASNGIATLTIQKAGE